MNVAAYSLAVAATILVWGMYYINRPHPWNLWTYLFLYVFLIADLFDSHFLKHSWRAKPFALLDGRIALLALFVLPTLVSSNVHSFLAALEPRPRTEMAAVSGVLVPRAVGATLLTKARFLASQPKDTVFVTEYAYSLALLTNRFDNLPVQDVFGETLTNDQFGRLVAHIQQRKPPVILFDEPQTDLDPADSLSYHQAFFARLRLALSGSYREVATTHGWRVLTSPPGGPEVASVMRFGSAASYRDERSTDARRVSRDDEGRNRDVAAARPHRSTRAAEIRK